MPNRGTPRICLLDGKVENEHMKRHYGVHHNSEPKSDSVMSIIKFISSNSRLKTSLNQTEQDVAWCENWREIATAIANNIEKPKPINQKAQFIGSTKENKTKSKDREHAEDFGSFAIVGRHQNNVPAKIKKKKASVGEKNILLHDLGQIPANVLRPYEGGVKPVKWVAQQYEEEKVPLVDDGATQIQTQFSRQNIQISVGLDPIEQNYTNNTDDKQLLKSLDLISKDKYQRDDLAHEVPANENMSEFDTEDLAGCLGSQELQPFVSGKTQTGTRFSPFRGEINTIKMANVAVTATPVPQANKISQLQVGLDEAVLMSAKSILQEDQSPRIISAVFQQQIIASLVLPKTKQQVDLLTMQQTVGYQLLQVKTFKLFDCPIPTKEADLKIESFSLAKITLPFRDVDKPCKTSDKSQQISVTYGMNFDNQVENLNTVSSFEHLIQDVRSQLSCTKLFMYTQADLEKKFPQKWLYQNGNLHIDISKCKNISFKGLQLFGTSDLFIALSTIQQGSKDNHIKLRLECLCTKTTVDITEVITFIGDFISLCTTRSIVILTSRLVAERSMVTISTESYEKVCKLLRSQQRVVPSDIANNSILNFGKIQNKQAIVNAKSQSNQMTTTRDSEVKISNDLGKRRTIAGSSAALEVEIGKPKKSVTNQRQKSIDKMIKLGMSDTLRQQLITSQDKIDDKNDSMLKKFSYREAEAKAKELNQLANTIYFTLIFGKKSSVELNDLVLQLQRKKELGKFQKREHLVEGVKTLCVAIPDWIELRKTRAGEFIKRGQTKQEPNEFLLLIKSYLISELNVNKETLLTTATENSLINEVAQGAGQSLKTAAIIEEAKGKILKEVYIEQHQQIIGSEADADMDYDSPLVVSSVEQSEIFDYFEAKQIFKGIKKVNATKALVNAKFDELSKLYKPLKQSKKRTVKYRSKLANQLKIMSERILNLQDQVTHVKDLQDKTYHKIDNTTAQGNITINNNNNNNFTNIVQSPAQDMLIKSNISSLEEVKKNEHVQSIDEATRAQLKRYGYICKQVIGKGGFGVVYLCCRLKGSKYNEQYAVKVQRQDIKLFKNSSTAKDLLTTEMYAIQKIKDNSHINGKDYVVEILDVLQLDGVGQAFVMPYYSHTLRGLFDSVLKYGGMTALQDTAKYKLAEGIIRGVCAAHKAGIYHKDIKPDNIMIDDKYTTKLGDFGLTAHEMPCGTKAYMAPEFFGLTQSLNGIDWPKADAWSLGIVIFQLFEDGIHPFANMPATTETLAMNTIKFDKTPALVQVFILELLQPNPNIRKHVTQAKNVGVFLKSIGFETRQSLFEKACKRHGISEEDKTAVNLRIDYETLKGHMHISQQGGNIRTKLEAKVTTAMKEADIQFADWSQSSVNETPQKNTR